MAYNKTMRILVVEDEYKIANAIKRGLEQESYAVDVCYDADDGLASALHDDYDVIVLDRMLPGSTDGVGVCCDAPLHNPFQGVGSFAVNMV